MDFGYLHEVEVVELRAEKPRPLAELLPIFLSRGFTLHDDILSLNREGDVPPWQHTSIIEVEIQRSGKEVFGFDEGEWDCIQLRYLFASLPYDLVRPFIESVFSISQELRICPLFRHEAVNAIDLATKFDELREELTGETGEDAGSEALAIFIQGTYPRR